MIYDESPLVSVDREIFDAIEGELFRQKHHIELIASENIVSKAVLEAQGSVLTNKYAEGYSGRRYYGGCEYMDIVESLAIERAKELFKCKYANVQPHSGATANQAVFFAFLKPGDAILGMSLSAGGHLTHGAPKTQSGSWFNAMSYGVRDDNGLIDYDEVRDLALKGKPKMIIAGFSSYSRIIDWKILRDIAEEVGAVLMIDMAHIAGLVAGGVYPSPIPYAHVVTTTTHKTLRGPRGGMILSLDDQYAKRLNSAVFPGLQGGPLMHVIAAKAVSFKEALQSDFAVYARNIVNNAKVLASSLMNNGLDIVSGGTDCHMMVLDLQKVGITGLDACNILEKVGITANKNAIPNDPASPMITSGLRFGTPACTTRGFGEIEFKRVGCLIFEILKSYSNNENKLPDAIQNKIKNEVTEMCEKFGIY